MTEQQVVFWIFMGPLILPFCLVGLYYLMCGLAMMLYDIMGWDDRVKWFSNDGIDCRTGRLVAAGVRR